MDRLNAILRSVAAERPGFVSTIELQQLFRSQPGGELDPSMRPDGLHVSNAFGLTVGAWLGPQLDTLIPRA